MVYQVAPKVAAAGYVVTKNKKKKVNLWVPPVKKIVDIGSGDNILDDTTTR